MMDPMEAQEYQRMMELGSQNNSLQQQYEMAKLLGAAPEMRTAGRVTRAPHWLEYLSAIMNQRTMKSTQNKIRANQDLQNQMLLARLVQQQQQAQMPPAEPPAGNGMQPAPQTPYGEMRY